MRLASRAPGWPVPARTLAVLAVLAAVLVPMTPAQGAALELGYRDHNYGTSVTAPTADKGQSKLFHADGSWWGVLWSPAVKHFTIHKFNLATEATSAWTSTGVVVDIRRKSQSDVLWDSSRRKLYVVSHLKDSDTRTGDRGLKLLRFGLQAGTFTAELSTTVADGKVESAALDQDSTGRLWVTYTAPNSTGGRTVTMLHSTADDGTWTAPFTLPVDPSTVETSADDVSTIVAYGEGGTRKIGVLWSNQRTSELYFASHIDGAPTASWTLTRLCSTAGCPDDHLNIKSIDGDASGNLYAVVKTSLNDGAAPDPNDPLVVVYRLNTTGTWSSSVAWTVRENVTRAIVVLDSENRAAHLFAAGPCCSGGTVYTKQSSFDDLKFPTGLGTPFMRSERLADGEDINNVTSTKQTVDSRTGLLVLASIDRTRDYVHRYLPLGSGDAQAPSVSAMTPTNGATSVAPATTITASFSEAMEAASVNGSTMLLQQVGGSAVPAEISYDTAAVRAVLRPETSLEQGREYVVTVRGGPEGVRDLAGNRLAQDVVWRFTTTSASDSDSGAPAPSQNLGELGRASSTTSGSTISVVTTAAVPAGARVLFAVGYSGASGVTARAADATGMAWTTHAVQDNGTSVGGTSALFSTVVAAGGLPAGATITATLSTKVTYRLAVAHAFSGSPGTPTTSVGTGSTAAPTAAPVSAAAGDQLYSVKVWNSGTVSHAGAGEVIELAEVVAGTKTLAVTQLTVTASGTVTDASSLSSAALWTDAAVLLRP